MGINKLNLLIGWVVVNISFRQVQAFICIARSTTFAEAAEKMFISQPALSSAIKKMETQLGGVLFSRTTRKVELSPEGALFLPVALRLMNEWDEAFSDLHHLFAMGRGKLSIAAMPSFAAGQLPLILQLYQAEFPNIKMSVADIVMEEVYKEVREGRVEIGFTFEHERQEGTIFHPLFTDHFMLILPSEHPLNSLKSIQWQDIVAYPFVAMNKNSAMRGWIENHIQRLGYQLNVVAEAGQLATLGQFVKHGLGVSVVPGLCQEQMSGKGLTCIPLQHNLQDSGLSKKVGMVKISRSNLSVVADTFWHWVVDNQHKFKQ
ncbi:LysR family transcriptional regulator [Paraglaciecola hydrolytica]|uniref:LysR family transcriptional regulator n=1 Tax=Paraglaciecola hydrolytica TaxID=1799789 RepID=UPI000AD228E3|nr:LysR family transcriptional regulator [Paraglaciecola hydrolytica]